MKSILSVMLLLVIGFPAICQINFPDLSYESIIREKVGFTNFTISYTRPMARGRVIFGALVPFGKPWRTGAGPSTKISFDKPVTFGDKLLEKGTYALVTIPGVRSWAVILHRDTTIFSENRPYDESNEAARISVNAEFSKRHTEAFTISVDIVNNDAAFILSWGATQIPFLIKTHTTKAMFENIRMMLEYDTVKDAEALGDAANFIAYHLKWLPNSAKDTAILLIDKAMALGKEPWMYRTKRNVFMFSRDLANYEKTTREWLSYYKQEKREGDLADEIKYIEEELRLFRKSFE